MYHKEIQIKNYSIHNLRKYRNLTKLEFCLQRTHLPVPNFPSYFYSKIYSENRNSRILNSGQDFGPCIYNYMLIVRLASPLVDNQLIVKTQLTVKVYNDPWVLHCFDVLHGHVHMY